MKSRVYLVCQRSQRSAGGSALRSQGLRLPTPKKRTRELNDITGGGEAAVTHTHTHKKMR